MMIITFASSKGGVGKSTACACLAGSLLDQGRRVHIVDLDGNRTLTRWLGPLGSDMPQLTLATPDTQALTEHLEAQGRGGAPDAILIDVAGAYERAITVAMARAHLTIIPAAPTEADLFEASRVAGHLKSVFAAFGREPLYRLLLTQVQPLASHAQAHAFHEVDRLALPRFDTVLTHRAAYQEIGFSGKPPHLADLARTSVQKAKAEVDAWQKEIQSLLGKKQPERKAAA